MYPRTKEERKAEGAVWEMRSANPKYGEHRAELLIFDKSGGVRSRTMFDKEDLEHLRHAINRALGAE
jgi:hypothetical protein